MLLVSSKSAAELRLRIVEAKQYWETKIPELTEPIKKTREILLSGLEQAGETVLAFFNKRDSLTSSENRTWKIKVKAAKNVLGYHGIFIRFASSPRASKRRKMRS